MQKNKLTNDVLVNIIIEELNSCKIAQLFFVSVSGEKKI